jgi:glycosyltransferase involved in cell wall biosynthesis
MGPRGGTEILLEKLASYVDRRLLARVNLITSRTGMENLRSDLPNVLWHHLYTDQDNSSGFANSEFIDALDRIVFVSNWQMEEFISKFSIPRSRCTVLLNAIDTIDWVEKPRKEKLKLLYTSTPWRGLEVLLDSYTMMGRSDVELDVYSSTVIYGTSFMPRGYDWLFNRCRQTPGVNYRGYVANKAVVRACSGSHILAYPSIFRETSCLSAIEAGAAGLKIVTTDLGALSETCGQWATYTPVGPELVKEYAGALGASIDAYWQNYSVLREQAEWFNRVYSWNTRRIEWTNLLEEICVK